MAEQPIFVARQSDIDALNSRWDEAKGGKAQLLRLQAPFGGGRRALMGEFFRTMSTDQEPIIWRVQCLDQENGIQWLVRMYGSLTAALTRDQTRRGKVEMVLNAQLPSQPQRVQNWYQQFITSLKESKVEEGGQVQLRLPKDNPLIGLVEVIAGIARKIPVVLELQSPYVVNSLSLALFVEALNEAAKGGGMLMQVLYDEPESDVTKALHPMPLLDLYSRQADNIHVHAIEGWGEAEVSKYLEGKKFKGNSAAIAKIADGRPGFIAELIDILKESNKLEDDLTDVTFASLVPTALDESELELDGEPTKEGDRKKATPEDVGRVTFLAALLGAAFPSNLVADMGGFERESIDDILDAMGDLFEEVQFSKELGTWIYRFKRGCWREGILQLNDTDEGRGLAQRVGIFMERFLVPRGYGFIVKTARVYAESGAAGRANMMRASALSNDAQDIWGLTYDFIKHYDAIEWPKPLRRTIWMNLLDRLVGMGNVQAAEKIHAEVSEWAENEQDRELNAWLLLNGSKLDFRRQDLYRARDRARDALKMYEALENKQRTSELHNHLATIELQDGNPNAAIEHVNKALEAAKVEQDGQNVIPPSVAATSEQIRGLVARSQGKIPEAIEHFKKANEIAGQTGLASLALDSGFSYGEALLASGKRQEARDALERVLQIARSLRNPIRERAACELLAQAEASLQNFDKALPLATRVLELTQALRYDHMLPVDLYNLGFFHYVNKKPSEALSYFKQSEQRISALGNHPVVKELHYFKGVSHFAIGEFNEAKTSLRSSLRPLQTAKDFPKLCSALDHLARIEERTGNAGAAKKYLTDAIGFAQQANLKEQRKTLKKRLDAIA